jgi:membrane protease YdiL (CAAX protease family)
MKKPLLPFIVYLVFFYLAWTVVWVHGIYPWATRTIGDATFAYACINLLCRFLIWILPVVCYLHFVDRVDVLEYLQLKQYWQRGIFVGLALSALNLLGTVARIGLPVWSSVHLTWNSILGTSILVGVFEEIPFRGFVLHKLQERFDFATATIISSALFVAAHVPGWIMLGSLTVYNIGYIFGFGAIMALILRFTRSLWAPIVFHSLNDGLSHVLFHI